MSCSLPRKLLHPRHAHCSQDTWVPLSADDGVTSRSSFSSALIQKSRNRLPGMSGWPPRCFQAVFLTQESPAWCFPLPGLGVTWGFLALPPFSQAGTPGFGQIYSHYGGLGAVAARVLIHQHTVQGKRFGAVSNAAGTRKVDRSWKRSFLIKPGQKKHQKGEGKSEDQNVPAGEGAAPTMGSQRCHPSLRKPTSSKTCLSFPQRMLGGKSCQALLDLIQQKERGESSLEARAWTYLEKRRPGSR